MITKTRIGIDIDGTIADQLSAVFLFLEFNFGMKPINSIENVNSYYYKLTFQKSNIHPHIKNLTTFDNKIRISDILFKFASKPEFLQFLSPILNAQKSVEILSKNNEIIIITARNDKKLKMTEGWLSEHEFKFDEIIYSEPESKYKFQIDYLIEDNPIAAISSAKAGIPVFLLTRPYNVKNTWLGIIKRRQFKKLLKKGIIKRCENWEEILANF